MQFNQTYVPDEASVQINKPTEQISYNQVLLQNCQIQKHYNQGLPQNWSAIPDCPPNLETLQQRENVELHFNQTYVPDKTSVQVNKPMDQKHYSQVLPPNCHCPPDMETLLQRESVEQFQQEAEQSKNYLFSKGHRSSGMSLTNRRERNRERERQRQTRLKGAFNALRSVIPDYFSGREPGDRLSQIQTLRLAKKYIATLHELLETC